MICAWDALLGILPQWLRADVDRLGKDSMQELRLRINAPPELVLGTKSLFLNRLISSEDISFTVNSASHYSPWASESLSKGYLTAPGGHRIGVCGTVVSKEGKITSIRQLQSLNIRIARDFPGIGDAVCSANGSVLILGAPGWGKSTLLRDMIRQLSQRECVAVIDERAELFPEGIRRGKKMDVLTGATKRQGIEMLLRCMGPEWIAVDEITAAEDCDAVLQAYGCGVQLIATAHGRSLEDFHRRPVYRQLEKSGVFETVFVLQSDKTFRKERIHYAV